MRKYTFTYHRNEKLLVNRFFGYIDGAFIVDNLMSTIKKYPLSDTKSLMYMIIDVRYIEGYSSKLIDSALMSYDYFRAKRLMNLTTMKAFALYDPKNVGSLSYLNRFKKIKSRLELIGYNPYELFESETELKKYIGLHNDFELISNDD